MASFSGHDVLHFMSQQNANGQAEFVLPLSSFVWKTHSSSCLACRTPRLRLGLDLDFNRKKKYLFAGLFSFSASLHGAVEGILCRAGAVFLFMASRLIFLVGDGQCGSPLVYPNHITKMSIVSAFSAEFNA
jgi:hypothetical protein